jgi:replication-associated recombination protein RarA
VEVFSPPRIQIYRWDSSLQQITARLIASSCWKGMDHVNRATTENPSFEVIPALLSVVKFMY